MKRIALCFLFLISLSCTRKTESKNPVKYFEFSFNDTFHSCFTLIYKPKDSLYIREHWSANDIYDTVKSPKSKTNYSAKISAEKETELLKLITSINFKNLKKEYFENYSDGVTYTILMQNDSINKLVSVHSDNAPKELDSLAHWILDFKESLILIKTKKKLKIKSAKYVLPPPPPPKIGMENKNAL
jgi:hypothetical protein